jgi:hypothetical protein
MNYYLSILIISILIFIYICCYFIYPSSVSILQTTLNDFDFNLLLQRQPLVIGDRIININDIINLWFSPNIIKNHILNQSDDDKWIVNNYKYMLAYCINDTEILLYQSGQKIYNNEPDINEPILAIKLSKYQCIIIPFKWYYNIKNNSNVQFIGIHDYVTSFISPFL